MQQAKEKAGQQKQFEFQKAKDKADKQKRDADALQSAVPSPETVQ